MSYSLCVGQEKPECYDCQLRSDWGLGKETVRTQFDTYFGTLDVPVDWVHDVCCTHGSSTWRSPTNSIVLSLSSLKSKPFRNATLAQLIELSRDLYDHLVNSKVIYSVEDLFGGHVVHTIAFSEETNTRIHSYIYAARKSTVLIELKIFDEKEADTARHVIDSFRPKHKPVVFKEYELRKRVSQFCEEAYCGRVMLSLTEEATKYDDESLALLVSNIVKSMKRSEIEYMPYVAKEAQCEKIFNKYFAKFPQHQQYWARSKLRQNIESGPAVYEQNLKFLYEIMCKAEDYYNRKE